MEKSSSGAAIDHCSAGGLGRGSDRDAGGYGHDGDAAPFHGGGREFQGSNLGFEPGYGGDGQDRGWQRGGFWPRGPRSFAPRRGGFAGRQWRGARAAYHGGQTSEVAAAGRGYRPVQSVHPEARPQHVPGPVLDASAAAAVAEPAAVVGHDAIAGEGGG
nr:unnamed protein product [Digitaria exilis]